jgi:hypothetical protein
MQWKYLWGWLPMVAIAVANGTLRQLAFQAPLGELRAHQLSTATGVVLFGFYISWLMRRWRPASRRETITIGLAWLVLTIGFEFGMGLAAGRSWAVMLHDYNLREGRVWVVVLAWVALAPTVLRPRVTASDPR